MTLTDYYKGLPEPRYPKTEFVFTLAKECKVPVTTARAWVAGERKPSEEHWPTIERVTGIPQQELFKQTPTDNNEETI